MHIDMFLHFLHTQDYTQTTIDAYVRDIEIFSAWFEHTTGRTPQPAIVTPLDIREYRHYLQYASH